MSHVVRGGDRQRCLNRNSFGRTLLVNPNSEYDPALRNHNLMTLFWKKPGFIELKKWLIFAIRTIEHDAFPPLVAGQVVLSTHTYTIPVRLSHFTFCHQAVLT